MVGVGSSGWNVYLHLQLISLSYHMRKEDSHEKSDRIFHSAHSATHVYELLFFHIVYNSSHLDFFSFGLFHGIEDFEIRFLFSHPLNTGNLTKGWILSALTTHTPKHNCKAMDTFIKLTVVMYMYIKSLRYTLLQYVVCLVTQSCLTLCLTPWTVACQAPLSMGFSRQEYWSGLPCLPPGDLPNPGTKPRSSTLQADSLPSEPPGKPYLQYIQLLLLNYQEGNSETQELKLAVGLHPSWNRLTLAAYYHPRFILSNLLHSVEFSFWYALFSFFSSHSSPRSSQPSLAQLPFFVSQTSVYSFQGAGIDLLSTSWQRFPLWSSTCNQLILTIVSIIWCIFLGYISIIIYYPNLLSLVSEYSNTALMN